MNTLVKKGRYKSAGEVVQEGLPLLEIGKAQRNAPQGDKEAKNSEN